MAMIGINQEHMPALTRFQHTLEWLQGERERLEAEHARVMAIGQRVQNELMVFLMEQYRVDPQASLTLDTEHGVIVTPDAPEAADAPEATDQPAPITPIVARKAKTRQRA